MIISHTYKFIFIKTRKTAGTSIEVALSRFCGEEDVITPLGEKDEAMRRKMAIRGPQNYYKQIYEYGLKDLLKHVMKGKVLKYYNHIPAGEVREKVGEAVWKNYFTFCFERNPWDRAVSYYFYRGRKNDTQLSFIDFLKQSERKRLSNFYLYSIDGEVAVDYVARYEKLEEELEYIARRIGLPEKIQLPVDKLKGSYRKDKRPYQELYTRETKDLISDVCKHEIEYMNYRFGE
jgi:hypothetical protein